MASLDDCIVYAELHCKTNFSFLEGASHASELVERAHELQYTALAITDRNSLAGMVRAHMAAKDVGLPLIVGAHLTPRDAPDILLWTTDRASYGRLCRLITAGRRRAPKGECELTLEDIATYSEGLLGGVLPGKAGNEQDDNLTCEWLHPYQDIFGDRCYLMAELHRDGNDQQRFDQRIRDSQTTGIPLVAAGNVHYHLPARSVVHDVITAIRHGTTVTSADGELLFSNAERHLRTFEDIRYMFQRHPQAIDRTLEIAERSRFSLDELRYEYPTELAPGGQTPIDFLKQLTWQGAAQRYPEGVPERVRNQLAHELQLIEELHYEAYFLTVWDLVRFARSRDILCQGRGSAANSAVCFCLGVTAVDPTMTDLLFERFISKERNEAPDIDVDFEHERREEVMQYAYDKYGRDRAGLTATVITYRSRSVIRDAGKALGLSLDRVDALAKQVDGYLNVESWESRLREVGMDPQSPIAKRLTYVVGELTGFPRHLSQHVGGMVFTQGPLCEMVPIENAAMPDRTVIQWDKDDLDELGILKVDCLCLGMLTAIHKSFDLLREHEQRDVTLASIPQGDDAVYDMMCRADTIGVFQIESRAQMSMLPRLKPRCYYDLVIEVAIVRPGPIQGNMVHPYLRRRAGLETESYPNDAIRDVLKRTLGVPIFQEQAMKLAVVAAGFTPGEADQLRRAMAAWRRPGLIDQFRKKLLAGMQANGLSGEFAEAVYNQIRGFGEYGFPESHAASFALLTYASAWLKHHYPAIFTAALINSQPLGFYAPAQLIRDAREHDVHVLPVDINHSHWDCTIESRDQPSKEAPSRLRLGFRMISGLRRDFVDILEEKRQNGPYTSVNEFARRTGLGGPVIKRLAAADAFGSLGQSRRHALWQAIGQGKNNRPQPLFGDTADDDDVILPESHLQSEVVADYQSVGLSLRAHPMSFHRTTLDEHGVTVAADLVSLKNGVSVTVAGLVLLRQRPSTAKGITFVTLEDETGTLNLVVHQHTWERYYRICRRSPAWIAYGELQTAESVIHIVVKHLEELTNLPALKTTSRDFR